MRDGLDQQYRAVASGYWPLIRYDPVLRSAGQNPPPTSPAPFMLDSPRPRIPLGSYTQRELRYRALGSTDPAEAERLGVLAQQAVDQRWDTYEEMATRGPAHFPADARRARPASAREADPASAREASPAAALEADPADAVEASPAAARSGSNNDRDDREEGR
jgi:pyruvate-ferredoxin/flavodoxin oxidoreductase